MMALVRGEEIVRILFKPMCSLHVDAFNVCMSTQIGQQTALAITLGTFKVDAYCVSEMHIEDPTSMTTLHSPGTTTFSRFTLGVSGDPASSGRDVHCLD